MTAPAPLGNAVWVGPGQLLASRGQELWLERQGASAFRVRSSAGASRGHRAMMVTARGSWLASPEGTHLDDREKGLWRSDDRGASWQRVLDLSAHANPVSCWGIAQTRRGTLLAGTYCLAPGARAAQIYRSGDEGRTWAEVYADPTGRHVHALAGDPWTGAVYGAIGDDFAPWRTRRIVRSLDDGFNWSEILPTLPQIGAIVAAPGARLFATDCNKVTRIYRTTDDRSVKVVLDPQARQYFFWLRRDPRRGTLFAGSAAAADAGGGAAIYRSADDGKQWRHWCALPGAQKWDGTLFASDLERGPLVASVHTARRAANAFVAAPQSARTRVSERIVGGALLACAAPVIALSAGAIAVSDRVPPLFTQLRHGRDGVPFRLHKLRTLRLGDNGVQATKLGRILRSLSIDELPQLWNVVKGDMALVGPRPHPIALDVDMVTHHPGLMERYAVHPGITGLAQISGARGPIAGPGDMRRRLALDLQYVRRQSRLLDVLILFRTIAGGFLTVTED